MDILNSDNQYIYVRRRPDDYRVAKYRLSDFECPHWSDVSGGVRKSLFGKSYIYGYVMCDKALEGEVAHSGIHGDCPHEIKVCALKQDNPQIYSVLLEEVGENPKQKRIKPSTGNTCKKDILLFLEQEKSIREVDLIEKLIAVGHGKDNSKICFKKTCGKQINCQI